MTMNYIPVPDVKEEEQDERSKNKADHAKRVQSAAKYLKGGFGDKKNNKRELFLRGIAQELFKERVGILNLDNFDQTIDSVFRGIMEDIGENAEEIVDSLRDDLLPILQAGRECATREVSLKGGVVAMDMSKAYYGWKPKQSLINATYFNAVD